MSDPKKLKGVKRRPRNAMNRHQIAMDTDSLSKSQLQARAMQRHAAQRAAQSTDSNQ